MVTLRVENHEEGNISIEEQDDVYIRAITREDLIVARARSKPFQKDDSRPEHFVLSQ